MKVKDLIISDLHLGDPNCNRRNILKILDLNFSQLIVNGDVFSCYHLNKLNNLDYSILEKLEDLQTQNRCVVIKGNHEIHVDTKKYTSLNFVNSYIWYRYGRKIIAVHGHRINLLQAWKPLKERVIKKAREENCEIIFTGHNHNAEINKVNGIIYVNTGAFTNLFSNYAVITDNKVVSLKTVKPEYFVYNLGPKILVDRKD